MLARRQKQTTCGEEERDVFVFGLICHCDEWLGCRQCQTTGDGTQATETLTHEENNNRGHAQCDAGYRQDIGGSQRPIKRRERSALQIGRKLSECDRAPLTGRE